jgi:26S proteasome regulatory subunit N9
LDELIAKRDKIGDAAYLFLRLEVARLMILGGGEIKGEDGAQAVLEDGKKVLDTLVGAESILHAKYYLVCSEMWKQIGPASKYYNDALMYLAYTPADSLSQEEKVALATDISLAALVGEGIYNFGEVIQNDILASLESTPLAWLGNLMRAFNRGDIEAFASIISSNGESFESLPALASNRDELKQKITLMAVMEMVFQRNPHDRTLAFSEIAAATSLPLDQVEWVLMKALSLGLIKGVINQVQENVLVSWVQPRVLETAQIESLKNRIQAWTGKVGEALTFIENQTPELFQ